MTGETGNIINADSIVENLTHTLLYEGYALYPYHRSAIKNQKPVPFGVVYPANYNKYNVHAHSKMQTQCIVTGSHDFHVNISVRFLHLEKTELFEAAGGSDFSPVYDLNVNGRCYQAGWRTIDRKMSSGELPLSQLIKNNKVISFEFDKKYDSQYIYDESNNVAGKQVNSISAIEGTIMIDTTPVRKVQDTFRITVTVMNLTPVRNAEIVARDEALSQSFLSTHTILKTAGAEFISHQSPGAEWKAFIDECENMNTWPVLIDHSNTTLLSSPLILYDYPQINPQSHGDLFDGTEIEEALLLHVALLSDDEKRKIAQSDEKLEAMLNRVSGITPQELTNFHSALKYNVPDQINNENPEL